MKDMTTYMYYLFVIFVWKYVQSMCITIIIRTNNDFAYTGWFANTNISDMFEMNFGILMLVTYATFGIFYNHNVLSSDFREGQYLDSWVMQIFLIYVIWNIYFNTDFESYFQVLPLY